MWIAILMILITGSDGFIGSHLVRKVHDNVISVNINNAYSSLEVINWNEVTHIYHLGAISSTTELDINRIHEYNIRYSLELFEIAIKYGIPVTYASSASVYGNSFTYAINPLNFYALSKATIDIWVLDNINRFSKIVGLRFFNVYGDGEEHKGSQASPLCQFTKSAIETGNIRVFESSDICIRDFISVNDVVECILTEMPSGIYDVGTSDPVSFLDVAKLVAEKYSADIKEIPFPKNLKNKYQFYTCARKHFNKQFQSVADYLTLVPNIIITKPNILLPISNSSSFKPIISI
jgi:ADP-L-glycero-D-manno-heptose 6-epimerase